MLLKNKKKQNKNKPKLLRKDSHSQCKSAGVAKQRLYDHGYGTTDPQIYDYFQKISAKNILHLYHISSLRKGKT